MPSSIRTLTDVESDRLDAISDEGIVTPEHCVTCEGKGTYTWYVPGSRTETAQWECDCIDQCVAYRFFRHCNIQRGIQRMAWDDATEVNPDILEEMREYRTNINPYLDRGIGLILHGTNGSGKTMIAGLLAKEAIAKGHTGYFTTFNEMRTQFSDGWRDRDERMWFYRRVKNSDLLVIDDVGKEKKGDGSFSEAAFDDVLRHRVMADKATIVTSNYSMTDLAAGYGVSIFSLMAEKMIDFHLISPDARAAMLQRNLRETALGLTRPIVVG